MEEKALRNITVTISRMGVPHTVEITTLAKDDNEIDERLNKWIAITRKGQHSIKWEDEKHTVNKIKKHYVPSYKNGDI